MGPYLLRKHLDPRVVVYICNSSTWEVEVGGSLVQGQPQIHSKTLSERERERGRERERETRGEEKKEERRETERERERERER
jgi:hypothetical protein